MRFLSKCVPHLCLIVLSFVSDTEGILSSRENVHADLQTVPKSLNSQRAFSSEGQSPYVTQNDKVSQSRTASASLQQKRQIELVSTSTEASPGACECMDYWECVSNNGHIYSYCGISDSEVCCFHDRKSKLHRSKVETSLINKNASNNSKPGTSTRANGTSLQDVDYFVSLEDGVGTLKQITNLSKTLDVAATGRQLTSTHACGKPTVEWKFDSKAEFKEWPWHVALLEINSDLYTCGGTLVANDLVVTAAHCVQSYSLRKQTRLKVRAGEYDVSTNSESEPFIEVVVDKILVHPEFNNATLANDIALVKLRRQLNYAGNVRPVCLTRNLSSPAGSRQYCVVNGWGRVNETSVFSLIMKEIIVPLWESTQCEEKLKNNFGQWYKLPETAVCAGERGHDACDGDGGGGLVCYDNEKRQFYLKGVTSFGIGCGRLDNPGVYTDVASYLDWIDSYR